MRDESINLNINGVNRLSLNDQSVKHSNETMVMWQEPKIQNKIEKLTQANFETLANPNQKRKQVLQDVYSIDTVHENKMVMLIWK